MQISKSSYLFSVQFLQQLSQDLSQSNFNASSSQRIVLEYALQLLDLELSEQAMESPDLIANIENWLESKIE